MVGCPQINGVTGNLQADSKVVPLYFRPDMGRPALSPQPEFGAHLARLREQAGLTQTQLAQRLGVPQSNVTFWERSDKPPRSEMIIPLASALGVSTDELLLFKRPALKRAAPKGKLHQLFDAASKLPRRQQNKIVDVLDAMVSKHAAS